LRPLLCYTARPAPVFVILITGVQGYCKLEAFLSGGIFCYIFYPPRPVSGWWARLAVLKSSLTFAFPSSMATNMMLALPHGKLSIKAH